MPMLMKEQAEAAGCALASFWVVRHHLWLSQSQLQQGDRDCLLKVPVEPTAMFGPHVTALIQQAQESRGVRRRSKVVWPGAPRALGGQDRLGLSLVGPGGRPVGGLNHDPRIPYPVSTSSTSNKDTHLYILNSEQSCRRSCPPSWRRKL